MQISGWPTILDVPNTFENAKVLEIRPTEEDIKMYLEGWIEKEKKIKS